MIQIDFALAPEYLANFAFKIKHLLRQVN